MGVDSWPVEYKKNGQTKEKRFVAMTYEAINIGLLELVIPPY